MKWDRASTSLLLDLCINEKESKFNWNNMGLTQDGWRNVERKFKELGSQKFTRRQMSNKLQTLKKSFKRWKDLQRHTGLGRNKSTGGVEAEDEVLEDEYGTENAPDTEDAPEEEAHAPGDPPRYLDQLFRLYGSPKDRGSFMYAGGVCASVTPPTEAPAGPSNKRATVDTEVDSPPKKKNCSTEDYMRQLTESIIHRTSCEQKEVFEVMEILRNDGVSEGSELYFKALDLFKNSVCRAEYKNIHDPVNRIAWIEWTWTHGKLK